MLISIILLIIGFIVLIKGADYFVDGAVDIANHVKVPKMLIGLTIVAFGTSAPEMAVSFSSILNGTSDILIGNVIGSNILNILLILGLSAVIMPLSVKTETVNKELPITLLITTALVILISDIFFNNDLVNMITRSDGIILVLLFSVFLYYLIRMALRSKKKEYDEPKESLLVAIIYTVLGLVAIIIGSQVVVKSATLLAEYFNVSERIISLTIVAFGTSLPELVSSIIAAKKKETDLVIGNIIGSNIFNICLVAGLPVAILGGVNATSFSIVDIIIFILSAFMVFIFACNKGKITRNEGIIMLTTFIIYYTLILI